MTTTIRINDDLKKERDLIFTEMQGLPLRACKKRSYRPTDSAEDPFAELPDDDKQNVLPRLRKDV